jgi:hypothetical protein
MLFPDLPNIREKETITQSNPIEFTVKPIGKQPANFNVSVKPSGEFDFQGSDPEIIRQIITTTDYNRDQNRKQELEILKQAKNIDMITLGVLASSILISFLCLFLSFNNKQQTQGSVVNNGEFLRRTYCQ